jgi:5-methylcytosine-specific restriction protein A
MICGFSFEQHFGDIGKGFIHVHHLRPLGNIGENYEVDPVTDLIPVCPNCHAMIHRKNPPYSPQELTIFLRTKSYDIK